MILESTFRNLVHNHINLGDFEGGWQDMQWGRGGRELPTTKLALRGVGEYYTFGI